MANNNNLTSQLLRLLNQAMTSLTEQNPHGDDVEATVHTMIALVDTLGDKITQLECTDCTSEITTVTIPMCVPASGDHKPVCTTATSNLTVNLDDTMPVQSALDILKHALHVAQISCTPRHENKQVVQSLAKLQLRFEQLTEPQRRVVVAELGSEPISCRKGGGVASALPAIAEAIDQFLPLDVAVVPDVLVTDKGKIVLRAVINGSRGNKVMAAMNGQRVQGRRIKSLFTFVFDAPENTADRATVKFCSPTCDAENNKLSITVVDLVKKNKEPG